MTKAYLLFFISIFSLQASAQTWEELGRLAFEYHRTGFHDEAILYAESSIDMAKKQFGETDLRYISSIINMGNYLRDSPKNEHQHKAPKYYLQALSFFKKYHQGHTLEGTLNLNYGVYLEMRKQGYSKSYYQKAYEIYKKNLGEYHPLTQEVKKKLI